jgi:hypothetical protein
MCRQQVCWRIRPLLLLPPLAHALPREHGNREEPARCQKTIVHLVSSVQHAVNSGNSWAFSDGGAGAFYTHFYDDLPQLDSLDWNAIGAKYWQEVTTQKSAEFLVADQFPWGLIRAIGCYEDAVAEVVSKLTAGGPHPPAVKVRKGWYY